MVEILVKQAYEKGRQDFAKESIKILEKEIEGHSADDYAAGYEAGIEKAVAVIKEQAG